MSDKQTTLDKLSLFAWGVCNFIVAAALTGREFAFGGSRWKSEKQINYRYSCINFEWWIRVHLSNLINERSQSLSQLSRGSWVAV